MGSEESFQIPSIDFRLGLLIFLLQRQKEEGGKGAAVKVYI